MMVPPPRAADREFESLAVGEACAREHTLDERLVLSFAELSGDYNPLHTDPKYAAATEFKRPLVHGMFLGALVSELVGMHLPGRRCLLMKETLAFKKPVFIGETVSLVGTVTHKSPATKLIELSIVIMRKGTRVAEGAATVRVIDTHGESS